ncbi:hypothetical protein EGW08_007249 [Elysia chlorotica]|uniref:Uncharacterized protein n=1 Tax=Elysia chlorotica TaxID=188477 RepID=A0A3S0ZRG3_ELYCH|nr:hypothetical protein EGW08_007249 [Elysia chlorotica]
MEIEDRGLVPSSHSQSSLWLVTVLCLACLSASSLILNAVLSVAVLRSGRRHQGAVRRAVKRAVKRALGRALRRNSDNDDEDESDVRGSEGGLFMQEPLTSSSDSGPTRRGGQTSSVARLARVGPPGRAKGFAWHKLFPFKSLTWRSNKSPSKSGPLVETKTEQLFPLLNQKKNGGRGVFPQDYTSSDQDVEDLFTAPRRVGETALGTS